jgi:RNA polymerase sigma-70 factor (ECF subfamily)
MRGDDDQPALIEAARQGDREAFASLYMAYEPRLRLLVFRIVRDPTLVEDALQEAALRALRSIADFQGRSSLGTWLHRIAYSTAVDLLRRRRQPLIAQSAVAQDVSAPGDLAEAAASRLGLSAALDALSVEQRVVVLLCLQLGFDYRSAGEIVGIPPGTVASRLSHARALLLASLSGDATAEPCSVGDCPADARDAVAPEVRDLTKRKT